MRSSRSCFRFKKNACFVIGSSLIRCAAMQQASMIPGGCHANRTGVVISDGNRFIYCSSFAKGGGMRSRLPSSCRKATTQGVKMVQKTKSLCMIASFVPQTQPQSSKPVMMPPDGNPNFEQSLLAWPGAAFSMDGILRISCTSSYPQAWAGRRRKKRASREEGSLRYDLFVIQDL